MRFAIALLFAGVASANLFERQNVPQCALTCISQADTGSCSSTDTACLCADQSFINSVASCITSTCSSSDVSAATQFAQQTCAAAGVTLSASATASGSAASGSATGPSASGSRSASGTASASASASSSAGSSAANQNGIPVLAAAALGLAAFAF